MNDLDLYDSGNDLAPYSPGSDLAPITPDNDDWGNTDVDYLSERPAPAPSNDAQLQQVYAEVGRVIAADLQQLGHPTAWINASLSWYAKNIGRDPGRVQRRHNFDLYDQAGDGLAEAFGNHCAQIGASQEYVNNVLWLLAEAAKRLTGVPAQVHQTATSADPTDQLSDSQYEALIAANERAVANTMGYLKDLWGDAFSANLRMVQNYFQSLPARDQEHLSQYSSGWIKGTSTPEVILGLYKQAIGSGSLPSGGAIASEIEQHEHVMKYDRKRWNSDERLQARYRELLRMRGY